MKSIRFAWRDIKMLSPWAVFRVRADRVGRGTTHLRCAMYQVKYHD